MLTTKLHKQFCNLRYFASVSGSLANKAQPKEKPKRVEILHERYGVKYTKLDIKDKELDQLMTTIHSRKKQIKDELIVVEGRQLVCEAVQNYMKLNHLMFANIKNAEPVLDILGKSAESVNLLRVPREDLSVYSILATCPGLIGIFNKPLVKPKQRAFPISVVCDNIREPNNVGSVIRLANALPAMEVLLPKGNADQWDTKAIRGSSGSVFHIPTVNTSWEQILREVPDDALVLVADNSTGKYPQSRTLSYDEMPDDLLTSSKHIVVVLGGETLGISDEAMEFATKREWRVINIDIDPTVNSLNTSNALAVILFEIRRKLRLSY